ncbi:sensor histidine kinase [Algoriphagus sp. AK58]|uniref:sensor histidine kinase n=1 Tax=Algoriphagus sp. AK58 TaxID=1406877 RepID=UPI00164F2342|nr:histidine kinase [Algoriphagus sp. AK58]MBC6368573.1 signal transduction histidine kinase [Algoriphagus sp. AK58]
MFDHKYNYLFASGLGVYSFLNIYFLDGDRLFAVNLTPGPLFLLILILCLTVWAINLFVQRFILTAFEKLHPLLVQFLTSAFGVLVLSFLSSEISGSLLGGPFSFSFQNFLLTAAFTSRINLFLNSVNAIYYFSVKLKQKAVEAEKLKALTSEAKLVSLNSHLNPHFFFNNLSALSVLIHEDVNLADKYLQKLSEIYRYILNNRGNELVRLSQELDFLKNYIDLLSIRFEQSLKFSLRIDPQSKHFLIPPAVLQLLVENVVKHNYFTQREPLEVKIFSERNHLTIWNKKQHKEVVDYSTGIGLQNISDRYRFLNQEIRIENASDYFQVDLPLIDDKELTFS